MNDLTKQKISESIKKTFQNGRTAWNKRNKMNDLTKQKISESIKKGKTK